MHCKNCNSEIKKGQKFCPKCGREIKNSNTVIIIIAVVITLIVAVTSVLVFTKQNAESRQNSDVKTSAVSKKRKKASEQTQTTAAETTETTAEEYITQSKYLVDDANLLTDSEKNELIKKLDYIRTECRFDIVIHTTDTLRGESIMEYSDDYYDDNGYGYGDSHDGCILVIDMSSKEFYISTCGYGITALTDDRIQSLCDSIAPELANGQYYDSMMMFIEQVADYL